jgi:glycosyltransferase, family 1
VEHGNALKKLIKKYGLDKEVKIIGALPHDEVFKWLENIDIYIQPSYMEGLCRAIVEAMSKACPVICTDAGGNFELIEEKNIYKQRDIFGLINILENINNEELKKNAVFNYNKSKKYTANLLNEKRNIFYSKFIKENIEK